MATETYTFMSQTRAKAIAEGEAKGRAGDILHILDRRKVTVDDISRERIRSCADLETLETWLDRSLTATTVGELFED